ncbi:MAG: carbohydrate ABC transporter permease [Firmicutes bacterium]|nr:carbohydrate ABC transporter permease [Bacillota bacterium]
MSTRKATMSDKIYMVINYSLLTLLAVTTVYPFIYFLVLSFNDGYDAMRGGIYLFPREFTLENYQKAFQHPLILSSFLVSVSRTIVVTILAVLLTAMMAYALSRKGLPGRKYIVFFFFFTMLFSGGLIPTYVLYRQLGIFNTYWVLVVPSLYSFFNAIIIKTYFDTIPESLPESARIDGASDPVIFFKIMLPLSVPVLATIALFVSVGCWNDWFTGEFFIHEQKLRPAATLLRYLLAEASFEESTTAFETSTVQHAREAMRIRGVTPESLRVTFTILIVTPVLCVYPFLQKYFVKGVMIGSLKE